MYACSTLFALLCLLFPRVLGPTLCLGRLGSGLLFSASPFLLSPSPVLSCILILCFSVVSALLCCCVCFPCGLGLSGFDLPSLSLRSFIWNPFFGFAVSCFVLLCSMLCSALLCSAFVFVIRLAPGFAGFFCCRLRGPHGDLGFALLCFVLLVS
jgi:hypothetical protein